MTEHEVVEKYNLNLEDYTELEKTLSYHHKLYLKLHNEHVISDTNLRQEEWITNSDLSSGKFGKDIFKTLSEHKNKKIVFEVLKNPYFPKEYLLELVDVQESYSSTP